jgi:hypothetical protein
MNKAKSDWIVMMKRGGVCMGSTPTRRNEDEPSPQAQNSDKSSTAHCLEGDGESLELEFGEREVWP